MPTQTTASKQVRSTRASRILSVIAIVIASLLVIGIIATSQSEGSFINTVFAVTPDSGRCGMSQREFSELPVRLQLELTETCNRPPDVLP